MLVAQVRPGEGVIETPEGQLDANAIVFDLALLAHRSSEVLTQSHNEN